MKQIRSFVGMDVHKATISISVAEDGRSGPVRFIGVIPNSPDAVVKMAKQLARHGELDFCCRAALKSGIAALYFSTTFRDLTTVSLHLNRGQSYV
jgi:hypothetical protein